MEAAAQRRADIKSIELAALLFTAPRKAFAALNEQPRVWFALLLTLASTAGLLFWYYSIVDIEWLQDQMLSAGERGRQMSEAERAQAAAAMSRQVLMWSSVIGGTIAVLVLRVVESAYYLLAGNLTNVQRSFKHWFAFTWWVGLPHLIGVIPAALLLLLRDTDQLDAGELQPLSLNALFFHRAMGEPGFGLLSNLSLLHLLAWGLTVVGIQAWSGRSWTFSAIFALLPALLIYGGWAVFAFMRS